MDKQSKKTIILKGIIKENPLFVTLLGLCPALATTTSVESALGMGLLFMFVLIGSNIVISLLRKIIPDQVKIPCYIVIIATFVTIVKMLSEAFLPELYQTLGVFISLIVVNCIVLGRAEAYASKNTVVNSFFDAIGNGLGYTMAIVIIAFFREILGTGGITFGVVLNFLPFVEFLPLKDFAISIFTMPTGAFIVLGCVLAVITYFKNKKEEKIKFEEKQAKIAAMRQAVKEG
ncbi:MAG: electron transport complex subunit E [Bacilli bacterium]|nr:electron transport complex subunit E [Bacilli bacterium]